MRAKKVLSGIMVLSVLASSLPLTASANYAERFHYDRQTFTQTYPQFTGSVAKEGVDFSSETIGQMMQTIQNADKATGENKYWLDKLLVNEGTIPDFSKSDDVLFSRGRALFMRSHSASSLGFVGDISYGDSLYVGNGYAVTLDGNSVTEDVDTRKNYPSYSNNIFSGSGLEVSSKKFITYNNSAVTELAIKNTTAADKNFAIKVTSDLAKNAEGDELTGQVKGPKMAQLSGSSYVEGTDTLDVRISANGGTTAADGTLSTTVTIKPGETYNYKVVMGVMSKEIPESYTEYQAYKNYDSDTAFSTHVEVYNQWWADNIPYVDLPNEYVKKVIYYRWWATRFNLLDANISGNDWQYPAEFEGVLGYNNSITVSVPWVMQDLKYFRTPLYSYGTWAAQGEISGNKNYQNNPGRTGVWSWDMMQYITYSGLESFLVHGGTSEMLQKFAKYGYDDVKGSFEEYGATQSQQNAGWDKYLMYYNHPPITGNDNDNVSYFYKRNYGSRASNISLGRVDGSSAVYGNADASARMYRMLYEKTGLADDKARADEMSALAKNIQNSVLTKLWTDDYTHMDVDKELAAEKNEIPGSGTKTYSSVGHGSFLHQHTGSTESSGITLNPWRDNNFFPFNFNLVPVEGQEGYNSKYKEMLKDYNTSMYPVFPFFTADQTSVEEKRIGLYEEFEKHNYHGDANQPNNRDYGSDNFALCNGGNYINTLSSALRYYPTGNITADTYDRLLQWMAFSQYVEASGDGTKSSPAIADASHMDANEFYWLNGYFDENIQFPSDGLGPDIKGNMTRSWIHHNVLGMMNFSVFEDVAGLQPRADDKIELWPVGINYDYYAVDNIRYHDHDLTIVWQNPGKAAHYNGIPLGYTLYVDKKLALNVNEQAHIVFDPKTGTVTTPENVIGAAGTKSASFKVNESHAVAMGAALDVDFTDDVADPTSKSAAVPGTQTGTQYNAKDYVGQSYNDTRLVDLMQKLGMNLFHSGSTNLALDAAVTSSYAGIRDINYINDGSTVSGSPDSSGNGSEFPTRSTLFSGTANATDYVQFDFKQAKAVDTVNLYFYNDRKLAGCSEPSMIVVQYKDADGNYKQIPSQYKSPGLPGANYNTVLFPAVTTDSIRVCLTHKGGMTTAVKEIQIYHNDIKAPLPVNTAPQAEAGTYDTVNLGSEFYLNGSVLDDGLPNGTVTTKWECTGVPAGSEITDVAIVNPDSAKTLVTFKTPGTYTFKLTAGDGELTGWDTATVKVDNEKDPYNAAFYATASATYTNTDLGGLPTLNDGFVPASSSDKTHGAWHNWGDADKTETLTYNWVEPVTINSSSAYFFSDHGGILVPDSYSFEYLKDDGSWTAVPNPQGLKVVEDGYSVTTFDAVTTKGLRLTIKPSGTGIGVIEWQVNSVKKLTSDWLTGPRRHPVRRAATRQLQLT